MLTDRETRKMIKCLNANAPDYPCGVFTFEHICEISNTCEDDMRTIVEEIVQLGLAQYATYDGDINMGIVLTQRGKSYKELQRLESRERWKERLYGFISGVLVTVIGGIIVELLSR